MKNILVLCTGNSCRSQMAEGYLQYFAGNLAKVYSAGIERHGVNPKAIQVMAENGMDISAQTSTLADEYTHIPFDMVITVCDNASEACPVFPGHVQRFHHDFPDPAKATGNAGEVIQAFRQVRDMIKDFSKHFVATHINI